MSGDKLVKDFMAVRSRTKKTSPEEVEEEIVAVRKTQATEKNNFI